MRNSCLHSDTIFNISHAYLYTNIMPKQIQVILSAISFAQKKKLLNVVTRNILSLSRACPVFSNLTEESYSPHTLLQPPPQLPMNQQKTGGRSPCTDVILLPSVCSGHCSAYRPDYVWSLHSSVCHLLPIVVEYDVR